MPSVNDDKLLENGEPRNRLGGFSALDYSSEAHLFAAMSDRGPDFDRQRLRIRQPVVHLGVRHV